MGTKGIFVSAIVAVGIGLTGGNFAAAQSYPDRLIKIVVPDPPGGSLGVDRTTHQASCYCLALRPAMSEAPACERLGVDRTTDEPSSYCPCIRSDLSLDRQSNGFAAAEAEGGEAGPGAAPGHGVEEGDEDAAAGRADGVAEGDGAAVDVDALRVQIGRASCRERV